MMTLRLRLPALLFVYLCLPVTVLASPESLRAAVDAGDTGAVREEVSQLVEAGSLRTAPARRLIADYVSAIGVAEQLQLADLLVAQSTAESSGRRWGTSRLSQRAAAAGNLINLNQTLTLEADLATGAELMVGNDWRITGLQTVDPSLPNYVSFDYDGSAVLGWVARRADGMNGGIHSGEPVPALVVKSGNLRQGERIVLRYRQLRLPYQATNELRLMLLVSPGEGETWYEVPGDTLSVVAAELSQIRALAPTMITPREPFDITVRYEDAWGNLAQGEFPSLEVLVDGVFQDRIEAGINAEQVVRLSLADAEQPAAIEIRSSGGGLRTRVNPQIWRQQTDFDLVWTEITATRSAASGAGITPAFTFDSVGQTPSVSQLPAGTAAWLLNSPVERGGYRGVITYSDSASLIRNPWYGIRLMHFQAEIPGDPRMRLPATPTLVEVAAGQAGYDWQIDRFASRGIRIGLTGSFRGYQRELTGTPQGALTAVMQRQGETLLDALLAGRTYVTTGHRPYIDVSLGGLAPGERGQVQGNRALRVRVQGTAGIRSITLYKNGEVLEQRRFDADVNSNILTVTLESDTNPYNQQTDLPRNGREWIGFIRFTGALPVAVSGPGFVRENQAVVINPRNTERLDFMTWTRGLPSSFAAELSLAEADVMMELQVRQGQEDSSYVPTTRSPSMLPAVRQIVSLAELREGPVTRIIDSQGYRDRITWALTRPDVPSFQYFEFTDFSQPRAGDYYYLKIEQTDDHVAWTSPLFTGGSDL
ncbi:MAG: hypothetical protein KDI36_03975 [Pseudomonadales bacterium]|nr:hypothetical protein [Pseudomonadales bacterium]